MTNTSHIQIPRELDSRESDGVLVTLLWHGDDRLTVEVSDSRTDEQFTLAVRPQDAFDTFHHPYYHATAEGRAPRQLRLARNA
jgi:carotenoid cleavage dioxygenase-like enzyme